MAACKARIVGGRYRSPDDSGSFGVKLDAVIPFELEAAPRVEVPEQWANQQSTGARIVERWLTRSLLVIGLIVAAIFALSGHL